MVPCWRFLRLIYRMFLVLFIPSDTKSVYREISNEGFTLALKGSLTNVGPLDALITFMEPVK